MTKAEKPSLDLTGDPFQILIRLIETLRGDQGCPWDRKQTPKSISNYLTEEVFELSEAITSEQDNEVCEELGDVLFQIFFIAGIFQDKGRFDIESVVRRNIQKMVRRHPHVFGAEQADSTDQIRERWHEIKQREKADEKKRSALDSVPSKLPALMRAYRISERAARTGFDWLDTEGVVKKVDEEWAELKSAIEEQNPSQIVQEFGDLLFTLVNLGRFLKLHPETSLGDAVSKFERRYRSMEKLANGRGHGVESLTQEQLDGLWEEVKGQEDKEATDS